MRQPRIRELTRGEEAAVCDLVARGFDEFVASDFGPEGIANFRSFSSVEALAERVGQGATVLVAEDPAGRLVGMVETTASGDHVTMLFVDTRRQGIGRRLMEDALLRCRRSHPKARRVTVHASRYAVPVYQRLGFESLGPEETRNGVTFRPMAFHLPTPEA